MRGVVGDHRSGQRQPYRSIQLAGEGDHELVRGRRLGRGVFIVSDKALYRFDPAADGAPQVTWRQVYANIGVRKPGQSDAGSGTTPTLMGEPTTSR